MELINHLISMRAWIYRIHIVDILHSILFLICEALDWFYSPTYILQNLHIYILMHLWLMF